ncbi:MAG: class I SAM-dependent methyltransferase [Candidatus Omnitrophica bacterium]|nr:class I SAM-dependent methyltransferase [Candidatus Omnitrophota bacterium]
MPTSDYHHIPDILHIVEYLKPESILDIGIGFGIYGYLFRYVLELYQGIDIKGSNLRIDGIEIYEKLKNPLWDLAYDRIFIGDAIELLDTLGYYDLITACDIIEHLSKEKGNLLIRKMIKHARIVIITSPRDFIKTEERFGDIYDIHKTLWSRKDFIDIPHLYKEISFTFMVVLSEQKDNLKNINILKPLDNLGVKKGFIELIKLFYKRLRLKIRCLLP